MSKYLDLAATSPKLTIEQLKEVTGIDVSELKEKKESLPLNHLIKLGRKFDIPASRFAFKSIQKMIQFPNSEISLLDKEILGNQGIEIESLIDELVFELPKDDTKANVDYEELECLGLDYASESLVATLKIKKNVGYSGDLCTKGSKEYISFWIDWNDKCDFQHLDTVTLEVHDLQMEGDDLCYSVRLPLNPTHFRKLCTSPNVYPCEKCLIMEPSSIRY